MAATKLYQSGNDFLNDFLRGDSGWDIFMKGHGATTTSSRQDGSTNDDSFAIAK